MSSSGKSSCSSNSSSLQPSKMSQSSLSSDVCEMSKMSNSSCSGKSSLLFNPSPVSKMNLSEDMSSGFVEGSHVSSMSSKSPASSMMASMFFMGSLLFTRSWNFGHLLFWLLSWGVVS